MNYYPFHIGDYLSATRHLSWEEDAAYRRLLDTYYTTEKALPADLRAVCRLVLATTDSQREAVKIVLEEFFELTDEGWRNRRADAEIAEMLLRQQKQRDKANKRWQKQATEPGIAPALPQHQPSDAAASNSDADAMPPTPTPVTPNGVVAPRKRSAATASDQGSRLPADWSLPEDWKAWCEAERPDLDPVAVGEQFRDFWVAKPGKDGRKADWQATWRNWCRGQRGGSARRGQTEATDWTAGVH